MSVMGVSPVSRLYPNRLGFATVLRRPPFFPLRRAAAVLAALVAWPPNRPKTTAAGFLLSLVAIEFHFLLSRFRDRFQRIDHLERQLLRVFRFPIAAVFVLRLCEHTRLDRRLRRLPIREKHALIVQFCFAQFVVDIPNEGRERIQQVTESHGSTF